MAPLRMAPSRSEKSTDNNTRISPTRSGIWDQSLTIGVILKRGASHVFPHLPYDETCGICISLNNLQGKNGIGRDAVMLLASQTSIHIYMMKILIVINA
ncbi:hypothetical protein FH972_001963 [Carpinus fangiana]|uniref:Uncharacterized protein n=1 Tax=Carpinus fangiana TaxID=176857 RepID=A0A5N6QDE2_9ROSI|nr:hypothetical protein FH972_001963 [Carpinus fangiana]